MTITPLRDNSSRQDVCEAGRAATEGLQINATRFAWCAGMRTPLNVTESCRAVMDGGLFERHGMNLAGSPY
jgi:hypothetical protein